MKHKDPTSHPDPQIEALLKAAMADAPTQDSGKESHAPGKIQDQVLRQRTMTTRRKKTKTRQQRNITTKQNKEKTIERETPKKIKRRIRRRTRRIRSVRRTTITPRTTTTATTIPTTNAKKANRWPTLFASAPTR